jgi:hypothetical protein
MTRATHLATFLIAICALHSGANAQKVYKCGSNYSQIPCPDGVAVSADDRRTAAEKSVADKVTQVQAAQAKRMEKERLKDEAQAAAQVKPAKQEAKPAKDVSKSAKKKKSKEPEYFTAKGAPEAKK